MRKYLLILFILIISYSSGFSVEFYVSVDGNDSNPGTIEKPFGTLEKARDSIREIKRDQSFLPEGATVYIRKGIYRLQKSFELNGLDGGIENNPIVYQSYSDEEVCLVGGKAIPAGSIKKVTDKKMLDRLMDPNARKNLWYIDLKSEGISDYGQIYPNPNLKCELFLKKKYLPLARYPNEGWLRIADVPQQGEKLINEGRPDWVIDGIPRGKHYGRFIYSENRPDLWSEENDIYAMGYWVYDWKDEIIKIRKIDKPKHAIYPEEPYHKYGYQKDARYYFLNIFEEIDSPGEWYVDRKNGILYVWPPCRIGEGELVFPILNSAMITMNDVSHVVIKGLNFEGSKSGGIKISEGANNLVAGCNFTNLGNTAVVIKGGIRNGVLSCNIFEISGTGVEITGGNRKTLSPCDNFAINNDIHHFARVYRTYNPAIKITGVGIRVSHNYIHDAPHEGIEFNGNDFVLEYNEITRVCQETEDTGAIYSVKDWTFCGTIIRYNYFHNIHGQSRYCDTKGVYLDLPVGGIVLYGNVFYDVDTGFFTNSGRNNLIKNNIFVKCNPSVQINVYRSPEEFKPGGSWKLVEKLHEVNYQAPPYSAKYPWLVKVLSEGNDSAIPYGNVITNNISYGGKFLCLHAEMDFSSVKVCDNYIADPLLCSWRNIFQEQAQNDTLYRFGDANMMDKLRSYRNIVSDPNQSVDLKIKGFSLPQDAPALRQGFKQIPFDQIGLQKDQYRKELHNEL